MIDFLDNHTLRELDIEQGYKPIDFGGQGITGSITANGRILAINTYHPEHGYVTLTSIPPFPDDKRYDAQAVRQYRKSIADNDGFGLSFFSPIKTRQVYLIEDAIPYIRLTLENGIVAETIIYVTQQPSPLGVVQYWRFSEPGSHAFSTGKFWLQRCAYTQLTEGGVVAMPNSKTSIFYQRQLGYIGVENKNLEYQAYIQTYGVQENDDGSVEYIDSDFTYPLIGNHAQLPNTIESNFWINIRKDAYPLITSNAPPFIKILAGYYQNLWHNTPNDPILRRGLLYSLYCCIPVSETATCIITDHMLLPLSWNRDAYFMAIPLMKWHEEGRQHVRNHLTWMFDVAERDQGLWGRSYLANGKIKDRGYQLDQQLYPILELLEYVDYIGDTSLLKQYQQAINAIFTALMPKKHDEKWLFSTDETPGDDPIAYPYPLSSHILMWHVCQQLSQHHIQTTYNFGTMANNLQDSIMTYFTASFSGKPCFAYATDGEGNYHFYHDANDIPLALAPRWGFIHADHETWGNTIDFAFSDANTGFYDGVLGSVHTPAPWGLGDMQEIIIAQVLDDTNREQQARERLRHAVQWDGSLSEAYERQSGNVVSRHWFGWPNAMLPYIDL